MRTLAIDRLTLEPQTVEHAKEMFVVLSDPAIYAYENQPPPSLAWLRERFARLESRRSGDGREQWLNWVIRLPSSELIGYVQATVHEDGRAAIAYELSSAHWGRGLAHCAVAAMIAELAEHYGVRRLTAVLKRENARSRRLLERLGFCEAPPDARVKQTLEPGETMMWRELRIAGGADAARARAVYFSADHSGGIMAKGYWIVRVDISDPERYKAYVAANAQAFRKYGARFLVRAGRFETLEGSSRTRNAVIEFPSYQAALDCWRSPQYQEAMKLRTPVSTADLIVIEGYEGPQP